MTDTIESALSLLLIGMITVFLVLLLVVVIGNLLIRITNRFSVEPSETITQEIDHRKIAAITAAVEIVTEGKVRIDKIEKVK
ncbi:MAG: oxaloacetate decarboxylase [Bacteroidota bacterium]